MTKRKLSKNQSRRIKTRQNESLERVSKKNPASALDEATLGPEEEGLVIAHFGSQVDIEGRDNHILRCFFRANLDSIVTGDKVIWRRVRDDEGVVVSCKPRTSLLSRPDSFGKLRPVAANIDQILITIAPLPEFHFNLIDRYLVMAEKNAITPVILINKCELINDENMAKFIELKRIYGQLDYQVLTVSAKQQSGMDEVKNLLKDKLSIFVGQSGVGKSSIIKYLLPDEHIAVGELSDAKIKGRHTTTQSRLFKFSDGGACIDSPGIREFGLWHLDKDDVIAGFKELFELSRACKFRDCTHSHEPHCAIVDALKQNTISTSRLENYQRILATLNDVDIKS